MKKNGRLRHIKKVKHIRWLMPGWVFYEYYKTHKFKGHNRVKSIGHGIKAEAFRIAAMASLPLPGTYELTTAGLALIKKKIERGEIKSLTLKAFRDFRPVKKIGNLYRTENLKRTLSRNRVFYFRIYKKDRKRYLEILYKKRK